MLIPVKDLFTKYKIRPKAILHVGAHEAEELADYDHYFNVPVIWVDAQQALISKLTPIFENTHHKAIHAAVWDVPNVKLELKVTNNSQSSSLLKFGTHKNNNPAIEVTEVQEISTSLLSEIVPHDFTPDFINLDIQGAELHALRGLGVLISEVKWIYTEVNKEEVYEGCAHIRDLDDFLGLHGFIRVSTRWCTGQGWGDALYIRRELSQELKYAALKSSFGLIKWYFLDTIKYIFRVGIQNLLKIVK